jgi:hypothetical protein
LIFELLDKAHYCSDEEYEALKHKIVKEINDEIVDKVHLNIDIIQLSIGVLKTIIDSSRFKDFNDKGLVMKSNQLARMYIEEFRKTKK